MVQLVVVAAGLSWIVELFAKNFDLIRFVGAAYLLFLGIQTLWKARGAVAGAPVAPLSANRAFGRGLAVAFANPKTLIFQAAFLPQFLTQRRRTPGAALAARGDLLDHHRRRRRHLGAVRGAAQGRRIGPRAADRRSRLRRHPDRGRRRAAPREPAVTTSPPPPPGSAPSRRSRAPSRARAASRPRGPRD